MEAIQRLLSRKPPCPAATDCLQTFAVAPSSKRWPIPRNETAALQQYLEVSLPRLRLVLPLAVEEAMHKVDWLARWLVRLRLGRVRCRILVSCFPFLLSSC